MPDNAFAESFNGNVRAECLNASWFLSLDDAVRKREDWRRDYNEVRPLLVRIRAAERRWDMIQPLR